MGFPGWMGSEEAGAGYGFARADHLVAAPDEGVSDPEFWIKEAGSSLERRPRGAQRALMSEQLPVIDVSPLFSEDADGRTQATGRIGAAFRSLGFFYAPGHAILGTTQADIDAASRRFFALPEA